MGCSEETISRGGWVDLPVPSCRSSPTVAWRAQQGDGCPKGTAQDGLWEIDRRLSAPPGSICGHVGYLGGKAALAVHRPWPRLDEGIQAAARSGKLSCHVPVALAKA